MKPNWSLKQCILDRVNKESLYEWAITPTKIEIPKYEKPKKSKSVHWLIFVKTCIYQFKP